MSRILALLSGYALPILGTLLVSALLALGFQTWRVGGLQQDKAELTAQINSAVRANRTNQQTIKALVTAAKANAKQFERALRDQAEAATRIEYLTTQIREQADDDIAAIENTEDACARTALPPDIRMRLDPRRNRDENGRSRSGASGPG